MLAATDTILGFEPLTALIVVIIILFLVVIALKIIDRF